MATAMESTEKSRFTDIFDEPIDRLLSPIEGYEDKPLVPLIETIKPISDFFNNIEDYVSVALKNCQNPADGLTQEESAAIHLYTMQLHNGPSLYMPLNQSLRTENREELKPWFSFLKLFLLALHKLPSQTKIVWRGIKNIDFSSKYEIGTKFAWWGVSSCTTGVEVLESNAYFGKTGERTLFSIECISGKSVVNHSYFKNMEKEIILMPNTYFQVIRQSNLTPELHLIHLKEIPPPVTLVKPPFYKLLNINPFSAVKASSTFPQLLSKVTSRISEMITAQMSWKSNTQWKQVGLTVAAGNGHGNKLNQLCFPHGIFIDHDQTVFIVDFGNHRIVEWTLNATNGRIVAGGNEQGNEPNQLTYPTDVIIDKENDSLIIADSGNKRVMQWFRRNNTNGEIIISNIGCEGLTMDKDGSLYVSDSGENEVRRWKKGEKTGTVVAGGNKDGNHLNQLSYPTFIFIDEDYSLYVSDTWNHRVMKWIKDAEEGIIVAGGNGQGNNLTQLSSPHGVIVDSLGQIYVADCGNNRVMRWCKGAKEGTVVIDGNEYGKQPDRSILPTGLSFDEQGNLYVADGLHNRIQKFQYS